MRGRLLLCALLLAAQAVAAEPPGFADGVAFRYTVKPEITYRSASNTELKLDLYLPRGPRNQLPTVVYFHGGGWVDGRKENAALLLMPYLAQGWTVINVEYRLARVAPAPAAVEDSRCALRWIQRNAAAYGLEGSPLIVAGDSAGGHLALMSAFALTPSLLDNSCPAGDRQRWNGDAEPPLRIAAIINWFGVADVSALLDGADKRNFAVEWFGANPDPALARAALARSLSPLQLVRPGLPPVVSVHGSADPVVPYRQSQALHAALTAAGVPNRLLTVPGANHGGFTPEQAGTVNDGIRTFLREVLLP